MTKFVKGKKASAIALLLIAIALISTVAGAYLWHYSVTVPSGIDVTANTWKIAVWEFDNLTSPLTYISFPSVEESTGGIVLSAKAYVQNVANVRDIYLMWNTTDLPEGMSITSKYFYDGTLMGNWAENLYQKPSWASIDYCAFEFKLTVDPSVVEDSYSFDVNFFSYEDVV